MSSNHHKAFLYALFSFNLKDVGSIIAFAVSPGGTRLAAATDRGSIVVYDTRIGHHQVCIDLLPGKGTGGTSRSETKVVWTCESQLIFSGNEGHLYYVNLAHGSMDIPPVVYISYAFRYHTGRITYLAYDVTTRTLVIAYDYFITIWGSTGSTGDRLFKLIDRIEPKRWGESQLIAPFSVQFLQRDCREIFVAGPFGYLLWSGPGQAFARWAGHSLIGIGTSALSPRTGDLVVNNFAGEVLRWRIARGRNTLDEDVVPAATEHRRFEDLRPTTTPAITYDDITIIPRQNHIVMVGPEGKVLRNVELPDKFTPRGIQTYEDRIYLALDGLDDEVVFMALTTEKKSQLKLEELKRSQSLKPESLTKHSYLKIDLSELDTVAIERANTKASQAIQSCERTYSKPLPNMLVFSTFYIGIYDVATVIRIAFTPVPDASSSVGKLVLLAHNDIENDVAQWLVSDQRFMSRLVVQLIEWVKHLDANRVEERR